MRGMAQTQFKTKSDRKSNFQGKVGKDSTVKRLSEIF